jgi:hypothetical protein
MSTDDRLTMALFRLEQDIESGREPRYVDSERVISIPWTLDAAIATFLNRWTWRGDRAVVEKELRVLIQRANTDA